MLPNLLNGILIKCYRMQKIHTYDDENPYDTSYGGPLLAEECL